MQKAEFYSWNPIYHWNHENSENKIVISVVHVKKCILIWYFSYVSHTKWTKIVIPKSFLDYFKRGETYKIKVPGLVCCSWQPPIYYLWRISGAYMLNCCVRDKSSPKDEKIYVYGLNITHQCLSIFSNMFIFSLHFPGTTQLNYLLLNITLWSLTFVS